MTEPETLTVAVEAVIGRPLEQLTSTKAVDIADQRGGRESRVGWWTGVGGCWTRGRALVAEPPRRREPTEVRRRETGFPPRPMVGGDPSPTSRCSQ